MTPKNMLTHESSAVEFWKEEKCNCPTCIITGHYRYDIPNTHTEKEEVHNFFEILDFERGARPS